MDYEIESDEHNQRFVVIHNHVARDRTITRSARGLLTELLSYRAGTITFDTLLRNGSEKRTALRRMLRELETAGYITRTKRRGERGRWTNKMVVRETPTRGENQPLVPPAETQETAGRDQGRFSTGGQSTGGEPDDKYLKDLDLERPKEEKTKDLSLRAREETLAEMLAAAVPSATEREIDLSLSWIEDLKSQGKVKFPRPWLRALIAAGDAPALVTAAQNRAEEGTGNAAYDQAIAAGNRVQAATDAAFGRAYERALIKEGRLPAHPPSCRCLSCADEAGSPFRYRPSATDQAIADAQSVKATLAAKMSAMCRSDDHDHCHLDWCKCPCGHRMLYRYNYPTSPYAA